MAAVMGVGAPTGGSFIEQMTAVFDQLPHAMVIVDMELPGVRQMYVNAADERLTGYPKAEQLGRNCRFLQGQRTEAAAVRQMVRCIRDRAQSTLRVTNYRKDGSAFSNILTLHPIVDSEGTYRYQVGVLSDASNEASEGPALQRLRAALPSVFDVSQQPRSRQYAEAVSTVSSDAQQAQWRASLAKFTRLVWSLDWEGALRSLCAQPEAMSMFGRWCTEKAPEDAMHLELLVLTAQLSKLPPAQQQQQAIALCERYLQKQHTDGAAAFAELAAQAGAALTSIASTSFPKFVQSKACLPLVESLVGSAAGSLRSAKKLIWDEYEVPPDLAGWVHSFVQVAETYPACIVLSDMSIPGNPMFFVNREFARVTGYAKDEAQGRNCRFLQGPKTEPQSVAVIQDTLRRGVDCHVKITNYRKSGEIFENLLTMRPVHDSNGVYRLCIGVQFEITRDMSLKTRLLKLERLIKLLPTTIEVSSATAQPTHMRLENEAEQRTELDVKLESALQGATVGTQATEHRLDETAHYDDNRDEMIRHLKSRGKAVSAPFTPASSPQISLTPAFPQQAEPIQVPRGLPQPAPAQPFLPAYVEPAAQLPALSAAKNTALNADVAKMAAVMGVGAPTGGSFIEQMTAVFDQLPHAMVIVDMELPGVRQMYVNAADERLTGYPKAEQLGRNCRFLQGQRTEAAAVRQMVRCIRDRAQSTLRVTNYRKDGSAFSNILTLHPIVDSEGTYRYQVGVLSDASNEASEGPALQRLRAALPSVFDVSQQPRSRQYAEAVSTVSSDAQQAQWRASLAKFTRLVWSLDWEGALRSLCAQPEAMSMFGRWCTEKAPEDAMHLELLVLTAQLSKLPPAQQQQQAIALCERYLQKQHTDGAAAFAELAAQAGAALTSIASTSFPKFVQSKACLPLVESLVGSAAGSLRSAKKLIWDEYEVPPDLAGWVHSFVQVAETYPACIVLSDMSIPGNPMFFVNREFARVTGYAKDEAQGRNCRFLQGPKTEPQSVAVIQDTLRRGVDCHVKITNYRKSGEIFENLLTMRPVHDSNGVYRLCIGVQFEITRDMSLKTRLLKLERLIKLLPTTIEVSSATAQPTHMRLENEAEQRTELDVKLESALQGATVGTQATEHRLDETAHYDDNRDEMLRHLKMSRR